MVAAQHLAVFLVSSATLAPSGDVVGIHLVEFVNAGNALEGAIGAVTHAFLFGGLGLLGIHPVDSRLVKHTDIQQALILFATQYILKDALVVCYIGVGIEFM